MPTMMKTTLAILISVLTAGHASNSVAESKWISLFNGKDLGSAHPSLLPTGYIGDSGIIEIRQGSRLH